MALRRVPHLFQQSRSRKDTRITVTLAACSQSANSCWFQRRQQTCQTDFQISGHEARRKGAYVVLADYVLPMPV